PADKGIPLEEYVALGQSRRQLLQIQGLQIAPDIHNHEVIVHLQMLYVLAGTEMVVDSIHLPWSSVATIIKHEWLQRLSQLRIKLSESFGQGALPYARRAREKNKTSMSFIRHVFLVCGVSN